MSDFMPGFEVIDGDEIYVGPEKSDVRLYLEEKASEPPREWLRRSPRTTHPEIIGHVRDAIASGNNYDDAVKRYVAGQIGGLNESLEDQLGHECYIAKGCIGDEERQAALDKALSEGWRLVASDGVPLGRCEIRFGTVYVGHEVATFGAVTQIRAERRGDRVVLIPKGHRTRGFSFPSVALIRDGWAS